MSTVNEMTDEGVNVVIRLAVVRPDAEYYAERVRRLLNEWDPYSGWAKVVDVDILSGDTPFGSEQHLKEALASLPERKDVP